MKKHTLTALCFGLLTAGASLPGNAHNCPEFPHGMRHEETRDFEKIVLVAGKDPGGTRRTFFYKDKLDEDIQWFMLESDWNKFKTMIGAPIGWFEFEKASAPTEGRIYCSYKIIYLGHRLPEDFKMVYFIEPAKKAKK